jgi:folate-binding protein YgfZ
MSMAEQATPEIDLEQYAAITNGAGYQLRDDTGVLRVTDADRVDFLQRMTTNNIAALRPGQSAVTVLTSPTARIMQVFTVLCRADDLLLLPAPGQHGALSKHLRGQIFFMDKVKVEGLDWRRIRLAGKQARAAAAAIVPGADGLQDEQFVEHEGIIGLTQRGYDIPGCELIMPGDRVDAVVAALHDAGAVAADDAAWTARRIELGRPAPGAELIEEYTPLEAGLEWVCAENKGCYTGQEIIARQITYDKVTKRLVSLRGEQILEPGAEVLAEDGRSVGVVTSATYSPALLTPVALAVVKRPYNEKGTPLRVGDAQVEVTSLFMVPATAED